ncbi:MAG: nucleotide pyrophosphohydrolase [Firmicutes bacterium]|nr:nucleotide pyrophosphohydrolase [Bacillota bacterium]
MKEIMKRLQKFTSDRNWAQFHTPDNLAKSIVIEASELLINYQYDDAYFNLDNVKDELADVLAYCLMLCDHYQFDLTEIMNRKIDKNEKKYPIDKVYGKSDKYTKL